MKTVPRNGFIVRAENRIYSFPHSTKGSPAFLHKVTYKEYQGHSELSITRLDVHIQITICLEKLANIMSPLKLTFCK